jgi:4-aminobutyrate aminotransferase-like enzyme
MFKLEGRPMRALVMELILASNGGELSNRFLKNIGTLARHHEFSIIVDEILTGARVGPKLLRTLTTPTEFQTAVGFVTLGKWPGLGIS